MATFIKSYSEENLFKTKFTDTGILIISVLVLALIALSERILYDLGRGFINSDNVSYFNDIRVITVHSLFIIGLLIISIVVNYTVGRKKEKYAIVLIPYFMLSILLTLQLALQITVYFANHHTTAEFYIVMLALVAISSYAIYYIQKRYNPSQN